MAGVRTPANPPNAHVNVDNEDDNGGPELGDLHMVHCLLSSLH